MKAPTLRSDALLLLTAAIWGFGFVAQRMGMDDVGPFTYNGVRFALGCLSLSPLLPGSRHAAALPPAGRRLFLVGGGVLGIVLFIAASLQQESLLYTTAGKAGFITGLYVVIVPLCGLFWGRRPGGGMVIGALLAAAGLYFLSVTESAAIEFGDGLVLASAFFWAAQVLLVAWLSPRVNPVRLAFYQFAVCSLLSLAAAFCFEAVSWSGIRAAALPILYGGILSVGVAYTLQVVAQRDAHPAHASILMSLEAVFAALGGWLLLDERMNPRGFLGCGLMLTGMVVSQVWGLKSRRSGSGGV